MKSLTSKPGEFRATCKKSEWKPTTQCTPEQFATATARGEQSRWDRKLKTEVLAVHCDETFDDAVAFERHMLEQHGKKPSQVKGETETWSRSIRAGWPGLRLPKDGKPFKMSAQYTEIRVCPTCDLHGQVDTNAGELWWSEHVRGCELAVAS